MRLRRLLALALVAGAGAFSMAAPVQDVVRTAVQGMTYDEILQWSNNQFTRQASFGRYVRWGGAIILGSTLIYTALDYFYNSLKAQTGTSLDTWMNWQYAYNLLIQSGPSCSNFDREHVYVYKVATGNSYYLTLTFPSSTACSHDASLPLAKQQLDQMYPPAAPWIDGVTVSGTNYIAGRVAQPRPTLPDWLLSHPDAADGVRTAVDRYIRDTPPASRANPYPGVRPDPEPNPNQWTDNPYADLTTDTDGDGWPDWMEKQVPWPDGINDPNSHPDPNRDDDGDGYTNEQEKQAGTDPHDPNSEPGTNPRTDTDWDGYPDDQELRCGSDPHDPASKCTNEQPKGDDLTWPGPPGTPDLPGLQKPNDPALPQFQPPQLEQTPWDQAMQSMRESIEQLKQQAMDKFPFGIVRWLRTPSTSDSGGCPAPQLTIGQWTATVNICGNPVWQAATQLRPFMLGGLLLMFGFTIVRRGLDVQR